MTGFFDSWGFKQTDFDSIQETDNKRTSLP